MLTETETTLVLLFGLWQLLVPLGYTLMLDRASTLSTRILYVFASIALSLLAMTFLYTIFSRLGLIDLLARLNPDIANYFIMAMVFICPLLIASGYYFLQRYNARADDNT